MARGGTGPNDPDNPSAPRNNTGSSSNRDARDENDRGSSGTPTRKPTNITKPGLQPGQSALDYDDWWETNDVWVSDLMYLNPERAGEVKALAWTYQDKNALYDALSRGGFNLGEPTSGGGGGRGGGGGGGGATKAQQYQQAFAAIRNTAGQLGLALDDDAVTSLARVVVDANWSDDMVMDYLAPGATNTTAPGIITDAVDTIKKLAGDQLLNVSDASAREWATKIASGEMTLEAVRSLMAQQATIRYGWAASQISQGITVRDMMLPNRDKLASELEMSAEEIDLMDSTWLGMLQTKNDDGTIRAATDSEIALRARQDARWQNTQAAKNAVTNMSAMLCQTFGF